MKVILKTINLKDNLDYNETFHSPKNTKIWGKLIEELKKSMVPNYTPSVAQLTNWLSSIHKSRRSQAKLRTSGKIDEDSRRVHRNSRLQEVRLKSALFFFYHMLIY